MKSLSVAATLITAGILSIASSEAYNILAIVPIRTKSHFMVIESVLKGLAEKGHNVTVVNVNPQKTPINNYHDIDISSQYPKHTVNSITIDFILSNMKPIHEGLFFIWEYGFQLCSNAYKDQRVQNLINTTGKFDLVITEIFSSDCFVPFAYKLKVPLVSIVTSSALPWMNSRVGNPDNPSYLVNYASSFSPQMTFLERLENFYFLSFAKIGYHFLSDNGAYKIAKQYFGEDLPHISQIYQNTSLILVNSHFSINQARPFVPNVIEIGGIHLKEVASLPEDFQILLDSAHNGAIIFSFGSIVRVSSFPENVRTAFTTAFSQLKQLIIWKYEEELLTISPNVILRKWIPQFDILAHKNVKLLMTHGGQSSCIEAAYHGVPVIGIPLFADQPGNVKNLVNRGMAIHIDYFNITADTITHAIQTILNDKSFKENAEKVSQTFKDRERTPMESAIYWIEYVVRYKGAAHLQTSANQLSAIQFYLLDIFAFLFVIFIATVLVLIKLLAIIAGSFKKSEGKHKHKSKKKSD
ncbi:UDP-glucosyltransferase 2 [Nilaparvata lugens]|uniref:UDP-glucosyltransferase 2 n=1 Tax=Nilaparvata lugens TaxID=108931 RepID=UPI00193C8D84|nr:UDP-glucosyltransferase 2 [Nilaparvata lugens]